MKITNKDRFLNYLNSLRFLGVGSQGACYSTYFLIMIMIMVYSKI